MSELLIYNIGMLATPEGAGVRRGSAQGEIRILRNAWIRIDHGKIAEIGAGKAPACPRSYDACGRLATPGLVDPHTHLVFGGWREHELAMKLKGVGYLEILAAGGGILSTVRKTRAASEEELVQKARGVLARMLRLGVTTCEAKSGYGLTLEDELKMLRVVKRLQREQKVDLVSTFMGAHALPAEFADDREGYLRLILEEMIPRAAEEGLAEFCDVFCEKGVFTPEETIRILRAAREHGLALKCHSDEIEAIGGTEAAAGLHAVSCEHLIRCGKSGIRAMAESGTIACLLPATSFYLNANFAPAREMISAGVPVAFGSDFNPGSCPTNSLQLAMNIGCYKYRMTPEECLTAVTLNAAAAVSRAETVGSLEPGKAADIVIWEAENLDYLFYRFGDNLVRTVFKSGEKLAEAAW